MIVSLILDVFSHVQYTIETPMKSYTASGIGIPKPKDHIHEEDKKVL